MMNNPSGSELGRFLKVCREKAELTLRQVQKRSAQRHSELHFTLIGRFETGARQPQPRHIKILAEIYSVDTNLMLLHAGWMELPGWRTLFDQTSDVELKNELEQTWHGADETEKAELIKYLIAMRVVTSVADGRQI